MSAILGVFGPRSAVTAPQAMLDGMARRGTDIVANWHGEEAVVAVARNGWELAEGFSDGAMVVETAGIVVAADATLYDRDTLLNRLRDHDVVPAGPSPSHLIAAAYRAWGPRCTEYLNGDYAFVIWEIRMRHMCAARSPGGKRPLFVAATGDSIVVASTVGGAMAHASVSTKLNPAALAAAACGLVTVAGPETVYRGVRRVGAGETVTWRRGQLMNTGGWRAPPIGGVTARADLNEGADVLRELLSEAVARRLAPHTTAVWLSGGWDSSAVWGMGQHILRDDEHRRMFGVSISYPPGDPGREDEYIAASARHWDAHVSWLRIADIPLFDDPETKAAERDEPLAHMFEHWNRSLARASRAGGASVALDGFGGDQLFQVSESYLIDLWRRGQRLEVWRDWHKRGMGSLPRLIDEIVRPARTIRQRGIPWAKALLRPLPPWLRTDFAERYSLIDRQREYLPPDTTADLSEGETRFLLESPFYYMVNHIVSEFALEHGVESRSPLFDERIVRFAASRPRGERASGRETKRLLRRAVQGLLPDHVLASRPRRTGVTSAYAREWMIQPFSFIVERVCRTPWLLEELGIIDVERYLEATRPARMASNGDLRVSAFFTLQTELWLRSRIDKADATHRSQRSTPEPPDVSRSRGPWAAPSQPLGLL